MINQRGRLNDSKGVALVIVIVVIVMLTLIGSFMANLGVNQRKLLDATSGRRAKLYYRAQAGIVDANWRIRTDYTVGLAPAGTFTNPAYDPGDYFLDVDGDGVNDTRVNISAVGGGVKPVAGIREIVSEGLDV